MKKITSEQIDVMEALRSVIDVNKGGNVVFIGTVRQGKKGKKVKEIEYESYKELAEKRIDEVIQQVRKKYRDAEVSIVHREGRVSAGEVSVVIAVSCTHRRNAFSACKYAIDLVKKKLPVWKKEIYEDGSSSWVEGESIT